MATPRPTMLTWTEKGDSFQVSIFVFIHLQLRHRIDIVLQLKDMFGDLKRKLCCG